MPEFIPVLIAAVLVFAGLLIAFGGVITVPSAPQPGGTGGTLTEELRHITIADNFSVGYVAAEQTVANISGTVSQGLLSGEDKVFSFQLSEPESITGGHINVNVNDSNLYGRLIVTLNGKDIFDDFAYPGEHSIAFSPELLKEENNISIHAESSGWRFWAPTIYSLSAEAAVTWHGALSKNYSFTLASNDVAMSTKGRLAVYVTRREGSGQLTVKLNGEPIYTDVRTNIVQDFTADKFVVGTNTLEFSAPAGTRYTIGTSEIIVYFT
jgi:hypothetical protein